MGWFYDTRCIHDAYVEREVKIGGGRLKKGREERRREIYNAALEGERAREGWKSLIEGAKGQKGNGVRLVY